MIINSFWYILSGVFGLFQFSSFFEAKMTKIVILDQNLFVPKDYQQFLVHFEWFYHFQISNVK